MIDGVLVVQLGKRVSIAGVEPAHPLFNNLARCHGSYVRHLEYTAYGFSGFTFSIARISQPVPATDSAFDITKSPLFVPFTE
jgi:hypothetical protein